MNTQFRDALYLQLVDRKIDTWEFAKDKKICDSKLIIKNKGLSIYINGLFKKTKNISYEEFITECAFVIYTTIHKFKLHDDDWEGMVEGANKRGFKQLIKNIKKELRYRSFELTRKDGYHTTKKVIDKSTGEKVSVNLYVGCQIESTDVILSNKNDEETTTIIQTLGAENSFWNAKKDCQLNVFYSYFKANKERILTKSQLELLDTLQEYGYSVEDKKCRELSENSNIEIKTLKSKLNRIQKKVVDAYNKEKKFFGTTYIEENINKQLGLLRTLQEIINNDDDVEHMNEHFSKAITSNADARVMENIFDKLNADDYKEVVFAIQNKSVIVSEVLYKLAVLIEDEIERLEISLANEIAIKEKLAKKEKVVTPEILELDLNGARTIYATLTTNGTLVNPQWERKE